MNGKISRLPKAIRDQLNRRLDEGEPRKTLLAWLNSLPEVQSVLAEHFAGQPVSRQNLHEWTQFGFRTWKMRQNALDFAALLEPESAPAPDPQSESSTSDSPSANGSNLTSKLVQWLALRFAATAHTLSPDLKDPDAELRRLRQLAADIVALRRGDLYSRRVAIEEQRLALFLEDSREQREQEFWEWTRQPDIRAKLENELLKNAIFRNTLLKMVPELAPHLPAPQPPPASQPDETLHPAALI